MVTCDRSSPATLLLPIALLPPPPPLTVPWFLPLSDSLAPLLLFLHTPVSVLYSIIFNDYVDGFRLSAPQ